MKLKNKTNQPKEVRIKGIVVVVEPKGIIEGNKIVYDKRTFEIYIEQNEKPKSSTRLPRKKIKRRIKKHGL